MLFISKIYAGSVGLDTGPDKLGTATVGHLSVCSPKTSILLAFPLFPELIRGGLHQRNVRSTANGGFDEHVR
jgi:hypothetical protein